MARGRHPIIIRVGKRIVPYSHVLGVQGYDAFHLRENQIIEVLDVDKYGRGLVKIDDTEVWMWGASINQCSNEVRV